MNTVVEQSENPFRPPGDPLAYPSTEPLRIFRTAFLPFFAGLFVLAFATLCVLLHFIQDGGILYFFFADIRLFVLILLGISLYCAVISMLFFRTYCVRLYDGGLGGHTFWGRSRYVPWDLVSSARRVRFLGYPYLVVHSDVMPNPVWIPLFLQQPQEFRKLLQSVVSHVGRRIPGLELTYKDAPEPAQH